LISLQDKGEVKLIGLTPKSIQGDHVIQEIMTHLGVESSFDSEGLLLRKSGKISSSFEYDFTDCPDLAQTVAVAAGLCKVKVSMTGLQSLRIKETDRITALKNELKKFNINFHEKEGFWVVENENKPWSSPVEIETYEDHRMAMAFMPACSLSSLNIKDPGVVSKSYPHFWEDVEKALKP
ncbi:MAG: 3-phosphoshikimate 1-carboxyvinyltransferase, partial [Cyclobacteriaceae bacterium]|nr:3-phosphoshikimate 1-carboxyvinyltransferase [Cyclobacteriaceae bacterium]